MSGPRAVAVLVLTLACRPTETIDPGVYDQACTSNADCVTVAVGVAEDACCSGCEASAISTSALGRYQTDRASFCASLAGKCPSGPTCPLAPAVCAGGFCSTDPACGMLECPDAGPPD